MKKIIWMVLAAATLGGVSATPAQASNPQDERCLKCIMRKCSSYSDCGGDLESKNCIQCVIRNCGSSFECG